MACLKNLTKIFSDGRHNAFTDMEYWKEHYYVAFRNGNGHARPGLPEIQGKIFIIRSGNLKDWEICGKLSTDGDDRDPALLDLGNELGVYFVTVYPEDRNQKIIYEGGLGEKPTAVQSYMAFTSDGVAWSEPEPVHDYNYVFWQVERFENICYAASWGYAANQGSLKIVRSPDGRDWETISTIQPGSFPNETGLWITDDRKMHLVTREKTKEMSYLSQSLPPYKEWRSRELGYTVHCPVFRPVGNELWLAGKTVTEQFPPGVDIPPEPSREKIDSLARKDERLAKTPQDWHTAIWRFTGDVLEPIIVLPSRGDCAYPGLVVEKDRVLMSYYSQHDVDEGPDTKPGECANEIFLAEIDLL